jgi:hypothetical protein
MTKRLKIVLERWARERDRARFQTRGWRQSKSAKL